MKRHSATWTMLGFALFVGTGCSPASMATRAIKEIKGASSEIREIPGTVTGGFDRFKGANISPLQNELGDLVSEQFTAGLSVMLHKYLLEEKNAPFHGGSPKLTIEPQMQWFCEASNMGKLFGSDSYAVVLFKLSEDGVELGRLEVATKEAAARSGRLAMAKSMAQELADWFKKRQKAERKKTEKDEEKDD